MSWIPQLLVIVAAWRIAWTLIYYVTGFWIGYITINNGILFNDIQYKGKTAITASSVRFRLWGNTRRILISDLHVTVKSKPPKLQPTENHLPCQRHDFLSIYPQKYVARLVIRLATRIISKFDVEFKNMTIEHKALVLEARDIQFSLDSRNSKIQPNSYSVSLVLSTINTSVKLVPDNTEPLLSRLRSSSTQITFEVNSETGVLSKMAARVNLSGLHAIMHPILGMILKKLESGDDNNEKIAQTTSDSSSDFEPQLFKRFFGAFQELSINIVNTEVSAIPLFTPESSNTLQNYIHDPSLDSSMYFAIDLLSIHLSRVLSSSAGFEVLFENSQEMPLQATLSSLLFRLGFEARQDPTKKEILAIPNFTFTVKTNIIDRLCRGYGFRKSVLEMFSSGTSPMLDITTDQLALLSYNAVIWKKLYTLKRLASQKQSRLQIDGSSDSDDEDEESTQLPDDDIPQTNSSSDQGSQKKWSVQKTTLVQLFHEDFPNIDVKLTVEQPRCILKVKDEKLRRTSMILWSYSLMVLQVLTTQDEGYVAKCQFIHPSMVYKEKPNESNSDHFSEEFGGFADMKVECKLSKHLTIESKIGIAGAFLNLSRLDALNGINSLVTNISSSAIQNMRIGRLNRQLDRQLLSVDHPREHLHPRSAAKDASNSRNDSFQQLLSWFVLTEVKCDGILIQLGSTSPLMPPNFISKLSESKRRYLNSTTGSIKIQLQEARFKLKKLEKTNASSASSFISTSRSSASLSTLTSREPSTTQWHASTDLEGFKVTIEDDFRTTQILLVDSISHLVKAVATGSSTLHISDLDIATVRVSLDLRKVFIIIGLVYLLMSTIVQPFRDIHLLMARSKHKLKSLAFNERETDLKQLLAAVSMKKLDLLLVFSEEFRLKVILNDTRAEYANHALELSNYLARILVNLPSRPGYWDRVLCTDDLHVRVKIPLGDEKLLVDVKAIRINQPYQFVVYKLFDNISIFVKVVKHLVTCLKSTEKPLIVNPTESKPIRLPHILLKSNKISFSIEDDPFDSDLNMIFQLGIVEQRKRLELYRVLEENLDSEDDWPDENALEELQQLILSLWIRKVKAYKSKLQAEIIQNGSFLYGYESEVQNTEKERIAKFSLNPPLLNLVLQGVDLDLSKPKFSFSEIPNFLYDYGQGVPKSTRYNLMIPMFISLAVTELRIHMRDYPLPLLHLPKSSESDRGTRALHMSGHLIMCEDLVLEKEHLRIIELPLTHTSHEPDVELGRFDKLTIEKSMATVKLFTDMEIKFSSDAPSRFVWGQSYQFGIQQIMLTVDQFSKPPVDPSPKLGFWDKLRLVMHGKVRIRADPKASLEIALKGGRDPYDLFSESNGFVLHFEEDIDWKVNEHDDSLRFFAVNSKKVSFYVPNYLSVPLLAWTRDSLHSVFMPLSKEHLSTCHGYYLNDVTTAPLEEHTSRTCCEKKVVELSGGVTFTVGFLLQRSEDGEGQLTNESKPHYEIQLFNPDHTEEGHDSYTGFRSSRIHMSMSLDAHREESYNTIHLSPGVFKHFFSWWKLFDGSTSLPIRKGKLFNELKSSEKFSEHLFTNKFLFNIKNLFISHIYRSQQDDEDILECLGLRAKVDEFIVDLHQTKQEIIDESPTSDGHQKVMKMVFNLGQVILSKIDLRTINATFEHNIYASESRHQSNRPRGYLAVFDKDEEWYDERDYDEVFVPSTGKDIKKAAIEPLLYSERFAYIRDTDFDSENKIAREDKTHECQFGKTDYFTSQIEIYRNRIRDLRQNKTRSSVDAIRERERVLQDLIRDCERSRNRNGRNTSITSVDSEVQEKFQNRFLLISMFLKWNKKVRNQFLKYIHFVTSGSNKKKFMSYEFMSMLENIIKKNDKLQDNLSLESSVASRTEVAKALQTKSSDIQTCKSRQDNFDKTIREVKSGEAIQEDYKIEIISPQIQLQSEDVKTAVVLVTAPVLECKILSVVLEKEQQFCPKKLERRYATLLHDATVMVIDKESIDQRTAYFEKQPYGTTSKWPPFLGIETCKRHLLAPQDSVLVKQMSIMFTYEQVAALGSNMETAQDSTSDSTSETSMAIGENGTNKLRIDMPNIIINSTSKQYFTLYATILDLLLYIDPLAAQLRERVLKLRFTIDFQDYTALQRRLLNIRENVAATRMLLKNYTFRHNGHLNNEDLNDYLLLVNNESELITESVMTIQTLFAGNTTMPESVNQIVQDWRVAADRLVLHMLNDDRTPILDLKVRNGVCTRLVRDDGLNDNRIEIRSIEGTNLLKSAFYEKFLEPREPPKDTPLITVEWSMNRSIGGIKIMENFDIKSLPLNVRVDEETGNLLMEFIFRTDEDHISESPVLKLSKLKSSLNNSKLSSLLQKNTSKDQDSDDAPDENLKVSRSRSPSKLSRHSTQKSSKEASLGDSSDSKIDLDKDVDLMVLRSGQYFSIIRMSLQSFELLISLKMKNGVKRLLNVTNFLLVLPKWEIERKIMSFLEVITLFKKLVFKALVQHSGRLLKNKLSTRLNNLNTARKLLMSSKDKKSEADKEKDGLAASRLMN